MAPGLSSTTSTCYINFDVYFSRFLEAAESGEIGKSGIFTIEEAATKLGMY